ncbi:hypothetical protein [Paenalcaligenes faecalis]|uniref:hypothetical protein n=1 Tax=Paenalcaligenes faecalis TaxID=2980099 RepID=UPI0022B9CCF3|nr:hypothetical protein [Paenalcaligenes faecalis]
MRFYDEVQKKVRFYAKKGGKKNRHMQSNRMLAFADFCEQEGVQSAQEVGKRHVIRYYKTLSELSDSTKLQHYYALRSLFELLEKDPCIPKP